MNAIHVNHSDNVGTALTTLNKGDKALGVVIKENVSKGHKFATEDILKGQPIIKYGAHIGVANRNIKSGEWVHIHNIDGERGRGDLDSKTKEISQNGIRDHVILNNKKNYTLSGFRRPDGSFGLRNHVLIIPSVHCANKVVERIANEIKYGSVVMKPDSKVVFFNHQHGCSELSYDASQTQDVLVGSGTNPNVYSVLVVGLGCEVVQAKSIAEQIKKHTPYKKVEYFNIQECGGVNESIKKGVTIVKNMLNEALLMERSEGCLADIVLGTECGGSDSFSGLSANPSLGAASDIVVGHGGKVVLAETTELIGAEHILAERAINSEVKEQILDTIKGFEQTVIDSHADIRGANPSPGNIEGGLSSIEEKSLGCIYKAGNTSVNSVIDYAKPITATGLTFMNTPGNDIEQLSGMAAGGCNIVVFTTGRGTPTGSPIVPTIKVSSNTDTYVNMNDSIDLDAGVVVSGQKTIQEMGEEIIDFIVEVGNGRETKAEINEQNDFSIWRLATTV